MPSMSSSFRDVFSFRFFMFHRMSHCTVRKCLMSKKKKTMDLETSQHHAESIPRAHQDSVVKLWVQKHTETGPVLEVKTFCHVDKHGIETQIPST